jgi:hypothetical protein
MSRVATIASNTFREVEAFSGRPSPLPKSRAAARDLVCFQERA